MKPVNILLLVLAGALGGAIVMKVAQRPRIPEAPAQVAEQPAPITPASQPENAPPTPAATPVTPGPEITPLPPASPPNPAPAAAPAKEAAKAAPPGTTGHAGGRTASVAKKHSPPKIVYSDARPSPFQKGPEPGAAPTTAPAVTAPQSAPVEEAPPVSPTPPARTEPEREAPPLPPPPAPHMVTLNPGMLIPVRLVDGLSSERNAPGDTFMATLDRELVAEGFVIAERGARVEGRVVTVDHGTKMKGGATLVVELTRLHTSDNQNVGIQTESFEKRSEPNHTTDAEKIGGGAAIGAIIGAIAGGGKGAAVGAGAGAGAGTGDVLLTRKPATLPSETRITFRLRNPITLTEKIG